MSFSGAEDFLRQRASRVAAFAKRFRVVRIGLDRFVIEVEGATQIPSLDGTARLAPRGVTARSGDGENNETGLKAEACAHGGSKTDVRGHV